jgi:hypothetical protein
MDSLGDGSYYVHACKATANLRKYLNEHGFDTRTWVLSTIPVMKQKNG